MTNERFFLSTGSKEIAQGPARMCSPNCLAGPPISTYFASPPTSPFYICQTPSPLSLVTEVVYLFFAVIGKDDVTCLLCLVSPYCTC